MTTRIAGRPAVVIGIILGALSLKADDPQGRTIGAPASEESSEVELRTGAIVHDSPDAGVAAFLLGDGGQFAVDEPISLAHGLIALEPPDDEVVQQGITVARPLPAFDPHNGSWFSVVGPDGQELPYQGIYVSWAAYKSDRTASLWPGEFLGVSSELNLSFDFSQPGQYRLRWHHGWDGPGLVSNEIRIEIVAGGRDD